ncbi:hypothetical protein WICPIJ_000145, partial [Wickerhamomyces pijperi]
KASKNEDDTPKVSKRLKQLSKNLFSRLFKRSSSNGNEQNNFQTKSLRSIDTKEGQLQFLQYCFPGTALDHFRFEQVQTPVSSGKEKDAFEGYTKYESDSDTEIETKLYKQATHSSKRNVKAVRLGTSSSGVLIAPDMKSIEAVTLERSYNNKIAFFEHWNDCSRMASDHSGMA